MEDEMHIVGVNSGKMDPDIEKRVEKLEKSIAELREKYVKLYEATDGKSEKWTLETKKTILEMEKSLAELQVKMIREKAKKACAEIQKINGNQQMLELEGAHSNCRRHDLSKARSWPTKKETSIPDDDEISAVEKTTAKDPNKQNTKEQISEGFTLEEIMFSACLISDYTMVEKALDEGADINAEFGEFGTCLMHACDKGDGRLVKCLIAHKANVNQCLKPPHWTPLSIAASKGYEEIVKQLLEAGAVVDAKLTDNRSALFEACKNGHFRIVKLICEFVESKDGIIVTRGKAGDFKGICPFMCLENFDNARHILSYRIVKSDYGYQFKDEEDTKFKFFKPKEFSLSKDDAEPGNMIQFRNSCAGCGRFIQKTTTVLDCTRSVSDQSDGIPDTNLNVTVTVPVQKAGPSESEESELSISSNCSESEVDEEELKTCFEDLVSLSMRMLT